MSIAIATASVFAGKGHAMVDQPVHRIRAAFDGEAHGIRVTQAGAGIEGVSDMRVDAVFGVEHR